MTDTLTCPAADQLQNGILGQGALAALLNDQRNRQRAHLGRTLLGDPAYEPHHSRVIVTPLAFERPISTRR